MKKRYHPIFVAFILLSLSSAPLLQAQVVLERVWVGESDTNDLWSDADNWENGNLPIANHNTLRLVFGEAGSYLSENTYSDLWVYQWVFAQDAQQYTISGERIRPFSSFGGMYIENKSQYMQIIETDLLQTYSAINIRTGRNGILWTGHIETTTGNHQMIKEGIGELVLQGNHALDTGTSVVTWGITNGTLVLDMANGGMLKEGTGVQFNLGSSRGGTFKVIGKSADTTLDLGVLTVGNMNGANRVLVDSNGGAGTHLVFSSLSGFTAQNPTLNFDLVTPNSSVRFTGATPAYTFNTGMYLWATVTHQVTVEENTMRKTGFAKIDDNGYVERVNSDDFASLPTSGASSETPYRTSGELTITASLGRVDALVIQGGGELKEATPGLRVGTHGSILMEEGVSDYIISVSHLMHSSSSTMRIFQYSEAGDLIIRSSFGGTSFFYNARLTTAGPGKIIIESLNPHLSGDAGGVNIQEGHLQLDGSFESAFQVNVNGGILSGRGTIGGGTNWANPNVPDGIRYTPVYVNGTLDASNHTHKALSIVGSLTLFDQGTYHVKIGEARQAALSVTWEPEEEEDLQVAVVTLNGNLSLDLDYTPTPNEWIVLLTTNGEISGEFLTVNGNAFTGDNGNEFSLLYNSQLYDFLIDYDYDLGGGLTAVAIQLQAIPEPGTIALLAGLALVGAVYVRRQVRK
jgi:hypothetical protein